MMTFRQPFRGEYPITQKYLEVIPGVTYNNEPHTGIDYGCPMGTEILASGEGTVMAAGWNDNGFGIYIIIQHSADKSTLYAHLSKSYVIKGDTVKQGQPIGLSGSSGNSTGPHLHFEARKIWYDRASHRDPVTYLPMMSMDDSAGTMQNEAETKPLKGAECFEAGDLVAVQNDLGVKAFFDEGFSYARMTSYLKGSQFYFTGDTAVRKDNGLTYMRVVPATFSVWIAVNDGETQLLDESG